VRHAPPQGHPHAAVNLSSAIPAVPTPWLRLLIAVASRVANPEPRPGRITLTLTADVFRAAGLPKGRTRRSAITGVARHGFGVITRHAGTYSTLEVRVSGNGALVPLDAPATGAKKP
jgi:hypothetical protein